MKELTATEASRSFSAVLDEAERGETFVVTRGGRVVASIGPAPVPNGASLAEFYRAHQRQFVPDQEADQEFADTVAQVRRQSRLALDGDPWAE